MIAQATIDDLPLLVPGIVRGFIATSKFVEANPTVFLKSWRSLIESGAGVIFTLKNGEEIVGAISGIAFPDINTGDLVASELFWFVCESHRGGGMRLYRTFEQWALSRGCKQIQMVHLADVQPERMASLYRRMGYTEAETRYVKALQ